MKLTVLSEVKSPGKLRSEHGLSFYIENDRESILFDTGASDIFCQNARKLGINLDAVDKVVLSHGHFDHGDGLPYLKSSKLYCHPGCFIKRFRKDGFRDLGINHSKHDLQQRFDLQLSKEPVQLTKHVFFLGEIPRKTEFEAKTTPYIQENGEPDFIMDDSGLAILTEEGLVVVSGCAHSGICNMIQHAVDTTDTHEIRAVIGGFHLKRIDPQTLETVECLKRMKVNQVIPSHCTMEPALSLFHKEFGPHRVEVGMKFVFGIT